ncbi:MAG: transglutaminase-like cysteine peptidase [Cohaesibacter sp.]|nr:transglutaminase-like cysteine peptidase [Cohaesibacter sp.]
MFQNLRRHMMGGLTLAALTMLPVKGMAFGAAGSSMRVLEQTSSPAGHIYYCANQPEACLRYGEGLVKLTPATWQTLVTINSHVNSQIQPVEDGPVDSWQPYVTQGDCEDYALTKQRELLRAGWPSDSLLITTAYLPDGVYHAVLVVRTNKGEFVLDNLNPAILPWQSVGYRWNKRQAVGNPQVWQRIAGAPQNATPRPVAGLRGAN